jgi:hypothetical protein
MKSSKGDTERERKREQEKEKSFQNTPHIHLLLVIIIIKHIARVSGSREKSFFVDCPAFLSPLSGERGAYLFTLLILFLPTTRM